MFLTAIFTPFGALGRWYLSGWNSRSPESRILGKFPWFPEGTWTANMVGATISALMAAFLDRYFSSNNDDSNASQWISTLLLAIGVGFAGSLSTVSSFVKETTLLAQQFPNGVNAFQYASTTLVCGAMIGICIYTPIVRI
jgi:fluoride ion exporter CrcB/FEX